MTGCGTPATSAAGLVALFTEAAAVAHRADVDACEPDDAQAWEAEARRLRAAVQHLGWLADVGASLAGAEQVRAGAEWWLLGPAAMAAVVGGDAARA